MKKKFPCVQRVIIRTQMKALKDEIKQAKSKLEMLRTKYDALKYFYAETGFAQKLTSAHLFKRLHIN